ncbi:MAG: DUF1735 and LamG domain-containing protein [Bacteroidales bacterium]
MKTKNNILLLFIVALMLMINSCKDGIETLDNAIYFANSSAASISTVVTIKADEPREVKIPIRLSNSVDYDVSYTLEVDTNALKDYNKRFMSEYEVYPASLYSIEDGSKLIKAGDLLSSVDLTLLPPDSTVDDGLKYAIPLVVKSENMSGLVESNVHVIVVNRYFTINLPYLMIGRNIVGNFPDNPMENMSAFTIEYNVYTYDAERQNVMLFATANASNSLIYSRIQDAGAENKRKFMFKLSGFGAGSLTVDEKIQDRTWYHMALTYDGSIYRMYFNGQEMKTLTSPGHIHTNTQITFGSTSTRYALNGFISEFRVWSAARTQLQIANNMYSVNPDSENLELYWKCSEGEGTEIKDYSGNERNGELPLATIWMPFTFPPE